MMHQKAIKPLLYSWGLFFALFLSMLACKRALNPEDQLPPEIQTGANTFGCLIDGEPWIPNGSGGFAQVPAISGGFFDTYNLNLYCRKSDRSSVSLYIKNVTEIGKYLIDQNTLPFPTNINPENHALYAIDGRTIDDADYNYITTSQYTGFVNITRADTLNKIISGVFEFEAIDFPSGKTIKISKGRFDINQTTR